MTPEPFRVVARSRELRDTWTLELEPVHGERIDFAPGQFTMLYAFGSARCRSRSRASPAAPLVHTVRAVGAVSEAICAAQPGDVLGVRGPFGNAWPVDEAAAGADVVIVAGGHRARAAAAGGLLQVLADRASTATSRSSTAAARRPTCSTARELQGAGAPLRPPGRRHRRRGRGRLARQGRRGAEADRQRPLRPGRRPSAFVCGPEIMMHFAARRCSSAACRPTGSTSRWSATCTAALGHCGHCQLGPTLICRDGPVYRYDEIADLMAVREL